MAVGKGPHEGRERNLGPNLKVAIAPEMARQIKAIVARGRKESPRPTFGSVVRRLVVDAMASGRDRPLAPPLPPGKVHRTFVRFEPEVAEKLRAIADDEQRAATVVLRGYLALALAEVEPHERIVGTKSA